MFRESHALRLSCAAVKEMAKDSNAAPDRMVERDVRESKLSREQAYLGDYRGSYELQRERHSRET